MEINELHTLFLECSSASTDTRKITKKLINNNYAIEDHLTIMNETDRTIVGLLWHENIIDMMFKYKNEDSICFYKKVLEDPETLKEINKYKNEYTSFK